MEHVNKFMVLTSMVRYREKLVKRLMCVLLFLFTHSLAYNQELDSIRSLKLIFEPIQEVTADQIGNVETNGVLGSLPSGIDVKVKAELEVADTTNLSKIYIKLGTQLGNDDLLNTCIDIQAAIVNASDKFFISDHIIVVELGTFPKPTFISCDASLENKEAIKSPKINYQTR